MFLILPQSLLPLLDHSYLNEYCSEAELLLKQVRIFVGVSSKHVSQMCRYFTTNLGKTRQNVGETLMLLAEQPRNANAAG